MNKFLLSLSIAAIAIPLAACETGPRWRDAQYWQRNDATSALYLQGPKAQQTLHQDISRCTAELNELQRLGSLRRAIPREAQEPGNKPHHEWDTPKRDGYRYTEHLDYADFETCMHSKGWERVEHLPYDIADQARRTWVDSIAAGKESDVQKRETRIEARDREPYDTVNQ